jgi:hypothetical protein
MSAEVQFIDLSQVQSWKTRILFGKEKRAMDARISMPGLDNYNTTKLSLSIKAQRPPFIASYVKLQEHPTFCAENETTSLPDGT